MGLIRKIFGGEPGAPANSKHTDFRESISTTDQGSSRNAPRRELVQVVLRDTMRKNGIPSDWIDCRILSVISHHHKSGMHVQFLVRKGDEQLLHYVHAFQESFWDEIQKFEPRAKDWLFSVGWEFYAPATRGFSPLPDRASWAENTQIAEAGDTLIQEHDADSVEADLRALQAALSTPAVPVVPPTAAAHLDRTPGDR